MLKRVFQKKKLKKLLTNKTIYIKITKSVENVP